MAGCLSAGPKPACRLDRSPRERPSTSAEPHRLSPASRCACLSAPVARCGASRVLGVYSRVSRSRVAAAWVPRHRPRPWPLDPVLAVFPEGASQSVNQAETLPSCTLTLTSETRAEPASPRVQRSAHRCALPRAPRRRVTLAPRYREADALPACRPAPWRWRVDFGLLSRGLSPLQRVSGCVHSVLEVPASGAPTARLRRTESGRGLTSAAAFRPRRFHDLDGLLRNHSCPGFPAQHSWGWMRPPGCSRYPRTTLSPAPSSPPGLHRSGPASAVAFACTGAPGLQGFALSRHSVPDTDRGPRSFPRWAAASELAARRAEAPRDIDRHRQRLVSRALGLDPSWASLVGTLLPSRRRVGPVTYSELSMSGGALLRRTVPR